MKSTLKQLKEVSEDLKGLTKELEASSKKPLLTMVCKDGGIDQFVSYDDLSEFYGAMTHVAINKLKSLLIPGKKVRLDFRPFVSATLVPEANEYLSDVTIELRKEAQPKKPSSKPAIRLRHYQISTNPKNGWVSIGIVSKDGWTCDEDIDRSYLVREVNKRKITTLAQFKTFIEKELIDMVNSCIEGSENYISIIRNDTPEELPKAWKIIKSYL